jgi:hypothetical protein
MKITLLAQLEAGRRLYRGKRFHKSLTDEEKKLQSSMAKAMVNVSPMFWAQHGNDSQQAQLGAMRGGNFLFGVPQMINLFCPF